MKRTPSAAKSEGTHPLHQTGRDTSKNQNRQDDDFMEYSPDKGQERAIRDEQDDEFEQY
jgi:hypothetical protein